MERPLLSPPLIEVLGATYVSRDLPVQAFRCLIGVALSIGNAYNYLYILSLEVK